MINVKKDFLKITPVNDGIEVILGEHTFHVKLSKEEKEQLVSKLGGKMDNTVIFWDFAKKLDNSEKIITAQDKILSSIEDTIKAVITLAIELQAAQFQLLGLKKNNEPSSEAL